MIYRPVRERDKDTLISQALALRDSTGHQEISLMSLSSSDYSCIKDLVEGLSTEFTGDRISVSLPSLRANHFSIELAREIQKVRKTGLTFAPEAGSQRLRDMINKGVEEAELISTVEKAISEGWRQVKLYFMVGLPGETMQDVEAIVSLCEEVVRAGDRVMREQGRSGGIKVTCSVSNFVPKAHTPYQWAGQASRDELMQKHARLKELTKHRRVSLSFHDTFTSVLEAVFARGDDELAPVLVNAYHKGCRFDSWTEHMKRKSWHEAFEEAGMDMDVLATKRYDLSEPLPWEHLDCGINKAFLWKEYEKSAAGLYTADCRVSGCQGCGVCGFTES